LESTITASVCVERGKTQKTLNSSQNSNLLHPERKLEAPQLIDL